jgi:hypothetical protein
MIGVVKCARGDPLDLPVRALMVSAAALVLIVSCTGQPPDLGGPRGPPGTTSANADQLRLAR